MERLEMLKIWLSESAGLLLAAVLVGFGTPIVMLDALCRILCGTISRDELEESYHFWDLFER